MSNERHRDTSNIIVQWFPSYENDDEDPDDVEARGRLIGGHIGNYMPRKSVDTHCIEDFDLSLEEVPDALRGSAEMLEALARNLRESADDLSKHVYYPRMSDDVSA